MFTGTCKWSLLTIYIGMRYRLHQGTATALFRRLRGGTNGVPQRDGLAIFVDKGIVYLATFRACEACGSACWSDVEQVSKIKEGPLDTLPIVKGEMREWHEGMCDKCRTGE